MRMIRRPGSRAGGSRPRAELTAMNRCPARPGGGCPRPQVSRAFRGGRVTLTVPSRRARHGQGRVLLLLPDNAGNDALVPKAARPVLPPVNGVGAAIGGTGRDLIVDHFHRNARAPIRRSRLGANAASNQYAFALGNLRHRLAADRRLDHIADVSTRRSSDAFHDRWQIRGSVSLNSEDAGIDDAGDAGQLAFTRSASVPGGQGLTEDLHCVLALTPDSLHNVVANVLREIPIDAGKCRSRSAFISATKPALVRLWHGRRHRPFRLRAQRHETFPRSNRSSSRCRHRTASCGTTLATSP